jgi:hypothetical protein
MRTNVFLDAFDVIELQNSLGVQFRMPPQLSDLVIVDLFEGDLRLVYDCMFDPFAGNEGPPLWQARYNKTKRHWSISAAQRPP